MEYSLTTGNWFNIVDGQIIGQSWGVPSPFNRNDIAYAKANGWFPSIISGEDTTKDLNLYNIVQNPTITGDIVTINYTYVEKDLATVVSFKLNELSSYRWNIQNGGTTVNGVSVKTDADSLTLIQGAKSYVDTLASTGQTATVSFKASTGFINLNQAQIDGIALAVGTHVQLAFANEAAHTTAILALTDPALVIAHDITTGWSN